MIPRLPLSKNAARRSGHTLVELLVSMTAATFLMAGLGSSLMIASRAFDGNFPAVSRSRAAAIQEDLLVDLNQATSFVTRTADAVSFQIPDRNGDGTNETLTYAWSGLPDAELRYSENGSSPIPLLENVQDFQLTYLDRVLTGTPLPPLAPNTWGERWAQGTFGYPTVYGSVATGQASTVGVRAVLSQNATVKSMSAYFTVVANNGRSDVRMAIYDVDLLNRPRNLIASTGSVRVDATGWVQLAFPPTPLVAGSYVLALSIKDTSRIAASYQLSVTQAFTRNYDATRNGFDGSWGMSDMVTAAVVSIYATYSTN